MTTKSIQPKSLLKALFTSQARIAILKLLLLNAGDRYYLREIATLAQQPVQAVQRELARLERAGLLQSTVEGNRKYYQANREGPAFPELKALLVKTEGLGDLLLEHLHREKASIEVAFLFGSYVRGEEASSSDIDLMVIGNISARKLANVLKPAGDELRREINPVLMSAGELVDKVAQGNTFILNVLQGPKIFLIGGEHELGQLAGGRPTQAP
jgi:DNA-binding transcriptional ArsR family regulator